MEHFVDILWSISEILIQKNAEYIINDSVLLKLPEIIEIFCFNRGMTIEKKN